MAYTTINKSSNFFTTATWSGTSSQQTISLPFQADWIWVKRRNSTVNHASQDIVNAFGNRLSPNRDVALGSEPHGIGTVDANGFNFKGSYNGSGYNESGGTYVSWNWKAGTSSGIDTTGATITPTSYSFNQTSGFSIIKYTGTGSQGKVAHGLGAVPKMILVKALTGTNNWTVKHQAYTTNSYYQYLNSNIAQTNAADNFTNIAPTDKFFYIETDSPTNASGGTYVAYCFSEKVGYSKFGSYVGNSSTDGSFIFTGFAPAFLIFKRTNATNDWFMIDNKRPGSNEIDMKLKPNANAAEEHNNYNNLDFYSNGFKFRTADGDSNVGEFIYMAIGQSLVGSNNVPCTAR